MYGRMDEKGVKFKQQQRLKKVYEGEFKDYHRVLNAVSNKVSFLILKFTSVEEELILVVHNNWKFHDHVSYWLNVY